MKKHEFVICVVLVAVVLTSCVSQEDRGMENKRKQLSLAVFENVDRWKREAGRFNQSQEEYSLEILEYQRSDIPEEDGLLRLQREIASGSGPDIIDFGADYSIGDIVGLYTENLFFYLEEDREDYFDNIITSFSYKGGLYAIPLDFQLETFVGSRKMLGEEGHWNIQEMMDCYRSQKIGIMLYPGETKRDVLGTILSGNLQYYVDWDKGECKFDDEEFHKVLEFCNSFPDALSMETDFSVKQAFLDGDAMILNVRLRNIYDICRADHIFGKGDMIYIGFPVEGDCGVIIGPCSHALAISKCSRNKDAAWQFLRRYLEKDYQKEEVAGFPICRSAMEERLEEAQVIAYVTDSKGDKQAKVQAQVVFEGEDPIDIYSVSDEQGKELMSLVESARINSTVDYGLYNILLEEADSYFCGDKTLEETARVMQSRANVYVNEKRN